MIIYFAGNLSSFDREGLLERYKVARLFSYYWHGPGGGFEKEFIRIIKKEKGHDDQENISGCGDNQSN